MSVIRCVASILNNSILVFMACIFVVFCRDCNRPAAMKNNCSKFSLYPRSFIFLIFHLLALLGHFYWWIKSQKDQVWWVQTFRNTFFIKSVFPLNSAYCCIVSSFFVFKSLHRLLHATLQRLICAAILCFPIQGGHFHALKNNTHHYGHNWR